MNFYYLLQYNLKNHICDAYKGPRKLKACNNVHMANLSPEKMKSTQAVCHANVEGCPHNKN